MTIGARLRRGATLAVVLLGVFPCASRAALTWLAPVSFNDQQDNGMGSPTCPVVSQCTAIDERGGEVTFDPSSPAEWSSYVIDRGGQLAAVDCPSIVQCTAVDNQGREVTFDPRSAGATTSAAIDARQSLYGIACPSASQCTAVGGAGQEVTFDPAAPTGAVADKIGVGAISGIACPSTAQCTAIQSGVPLNGAPAGQPQLITFDPLTPATESAVTVLGLGFAIECPSVSECVATAPLCLSSSCEQGATVTFDPESDETPKIVDRSEDYYQSLACSSVSQCTALDQNGDEVTFDPNSSSYATEAQVDTVGVMEIHGDIACPTPTTCTIVTGIFAYDLTFDPLAPSKPPIVPIDDGAPGIAVTCPTALECVTVAWMTGLYIPREGSTVSHTLSPRSRAVRPAEFLGAGKPAGVSCPAPSQCTAVTRRLSYPETGGALEHTYDPRRSRSRLSAEIDTVSLAGVSCPVITQCTAMDVAGREVTFDPDHPKHRTMRKIARAALFGISCPSAVDCVAVDAAGQEVTFDPEDPGSPVPRRIDGHFVLASVSCPAVNQCTAIDRTSAEVTFDPVTRRRLAHHQVDTSPLTSILCPTRAFCAAVDVAGRVLEGNPRHAVLRRVTLEGAGPLMAVACSSARQCVAVDADGHAFEAITPPS